ncbi:hypothetical protein CHITON_0773 [Thermococcus chitonophagus]|uniref:Uncharacterized protein n=1 Tax=Thermococcus chitonophagus TaxID=54262 RepID=A0A160VRU7_9EURY|nr:hypothetical protein CHITON_0773 [Thermococcus chitonophagus]
MSPGDTPYVLLLYYLPVIPIGYAEPESHLSTLLIFNMRL